MAAGVDWARAGDGRGVKTGKAAKGLIASRRVPRSPLRGEGISGAATGGRARGASLDPRLWTVTPIGVRRGDRPEGRCYGEGRSAGSGDKGDEVVEGETEEKDLKYGDGKGTDAGHHQE